MSRNLHPFFSLPLIKDRERKIEKWLCILCYFGTDLCFLVYRNIVLPNLKDHLLLFKTGGEHSLVLIGKYFTLSSFITYGLIIKSFSKDLIKNQSYVIKL